ncbi:MAG TPA: tetratricopeptide repeat protein [Noviherbaspirillum sp.]
MSLINQMLQELDGRRSDAASTGSFGQQVRAVYERDRARPMLWGALALAGALVGAGAWFWLRPSPVAQIPPPVRPVPATVPAAAAAPIEPPAALPLKLDSELSVGQPASLASVPQTQGGAAPAPAQPSAMPVVPNDKASEPAQAVEQKAAASAPVASAAPKPQKPAGKQPASAKAAAERPPALPDITKVVPHEKSLVSSLPGKASESAPLIHKQIKELTPQQRAENEFRKGIASLQQGKGSEAVASLEQALELDPMHAAARQTLIGILLENKHKDGAIRRAKEGLALDAAQPGLAMILARLELEKGELQPAIETLERSLPYAVDRADYQAFLAALLQRAERHKEAVEHYFIALQKVPQNGVWWMGVAISLQADRRKPEAIEAFKRAKSTNSLSPELVDFVNAQLAQLQQR